MLTKKESSYLNNLHSLKNKNVIITGSNTGIGLQIAKACLIKEANVYLACRNKKKANDARNLLAESFPNSKIEVIEYDQSNLASITNFVKNILDLKVNFDILICNAGIFKPKKDLLFYNQIPLTYGTNFIGLFYLLDLLTKRLKEDTKDRKIIIQGSLSARFYKTKNADFLFNKKMRLFKQYSLSKQCVENSFYYFSSNNINPHIQFLLCEPGITNSDIYRNYPSPFRQIAKSAINLVCHSTFVAGLSAVTLACNYTANGLFIAPKGYKRIKGYPKTFKFNKKYYNQSVIDKTYEILNEIKDF